MSFAIVVLKLTAGKYYITATDASPEAIFSKHSHTNILINSTEFTWHFPAIDIQETIHLGDIYDLDRLDQKYVAEHGEGNVYTNPGVEHIV
jgi:hypothetical protein